jgi:hypothetical protein
MVDFAPHKVISQVTPMSVFQYVSYRWQDTKDKVGPQVKPSMLMKLCTYMSSD